MRKSIALVLALTLGGCFVGTPYQPMGLTGGYSDEQLSADTYKIHVLANGYTSLRQAAAIAMLRASVLTLNAGYTHFVTVSGDIAERGLFGLPVPGPVTFINGGATASPSGDVIIRFVKPGDPGYDKSFDAARIAPVLKKAFEVDDLPTEPHSTGPTNTAPAATPHS